MNKKFIFLLFFLSFLVPNFSYAGIQEDYIQYLKYKNKKDRLPEEQEYLNYYHEKLAKKYKKKFFVSFLSLGNSLGLNFEFLFLPHQSILIEGGWSPFHYDLVGLYRWYFKEYADSYFVDIFARFVSFAIDLSHPDFSPFYIRNIEYSGKINANLLAIGGHIGRKWLWGSGFFMTLRCGYNYILMNEFSPNPQLPDARVYETFSNFFRLIFSVDIKFTLGWAF